jgi:hypothetical protein
VGLAYDRTPPQNLFLPMTLELGSWLWIKKNPRQLFSRRHLQSHQGTPHRAGAAPM